MTINFKNIKPMDLVLDATIAHRGGYLLLSVSSETRIITVIPFDSNIMEGWTEMSYDGDYLISSKEEWT